MNTTTLFYLMLITFPKPNPNFLPSVVVALVIQMLDSTIHQINHYPVDKY